VSGERNASIFREKAYVLLGFLLDPKDGSTTFLRSVGKVPPDCGVIPQKRVLWRVDLLLGNDRGRCSYKQLLLSNSFAKKHVSTAKIAKQWNVFSVLFVPRCYEQDS
jgi:hypothetical protein